MKRRDFLKAAAPATVLPFFVGGFSIKAFANNPFLQTLMQNESSDRVLVLIQLIGGNDGLSTLIPLDQYSQMSKARANILIAEKDTLKITDTLAFHTQFSGMQNLFKQGKLAIVQNVGYPTPNFSHFRSTDIWLTGSDYNEVLSTGWMGRYLDQQYPGYPAGYPNSQMPDPVAIQIGSAVSLAFEGQNSNLGMAFSDPAAFNNVINDTTPPTANTRGGHELAYVRSIGVQLQNFAAPVKAAVGKGATLSPQWSTAGVNTLADQLRIVAQLIAGGLKTKIYVVSLGGFDSHTDQRKNQDPLLQKVSSAISAFQDELKLHTLEDRVVGMTFSEFGRRIKSNDSGGTDHGAAAPMFVFGTQVIAGVQGKNPKLPDNATGEDNLNMEFDFRSMYASVLKEWLGATDADITNALLRQFSTLPIIKPQSGVEIPKPVNATELLQNYPNPSGGFGAPKSTQITFRTMGGAASLRVFDINGQLVNTLLDEQVAPGERTVSFNTSNLSSGSYLYRLEANGTSLTKTMVVMR